ncbi:MAG TPA: hypothetical protein VIQ81_08615 [Gammaproteobacteria bacterium]
MKNYLLGFIIAGASFSAMASETASDNPHANGGKLLHEDKCTTCHSDKVYTREERMVNSKPELEHQVERCMKGAAKADWSGPQTTSVIEYLNDRYYKF